MIFKRRPRTAIPAFWAWWETARPRAEKMVAGTPDDAFVAELDRHLAAIDPGLQWEFTSGIDTAHQLVVTAAGQPGLRAVAERWRRAAPAADSTFAYASTRHGNPAALAGSTLELAGRRLELDQLRFGAITDAEPEGRPTAVHVAVWHPAFPDLPDDARLQVAFLALDWVLGEDTVEIWVGAISAAERPGPSLTALELAARVEAIIPPPDEAMWSTMAGTKRGRPLVALVQVPLKPARWPAYDLHIQIDVPFRSRDENGFPSDERFPLLYALEDRIDARVDGAVVVAHETSNGMRTTHLYAERPAAAAVLEPLLLDWPDGRIKMKVKSDPSWDAVKHLMR